MHAERAMFKVILLIVIEIYFYLIVGGRSKAGKLKNNTRSKRQYVDRPTTGSYNKRWRCLRSRSTATGSCCCRRSWSRYTCMTNLHENSGHEQLPIEYTAETQKEGTPHICLVATINSSIMSIKAVLPSFLFTKWKPWFQIRILFSFFHCGRYRITN